MKVTAVIKITHKESMSRSVTTVPNDVEKDTPPYLDSTPQRDTSPTLGKTKLAA